MLVSQFSDSKTCKRQKCIENLSVLSSPRQKRGHVRKNDSSQRVIMELKNTFLLLFGIFTSHLSHFWLLNDRSNYGKVWNRWNIPLGFKFSNATSRVTSHHDVKICSWRHENCWRLQLSLIKVPPPASRALDLQGRKIEKFFSSTFSCIKLQTVSNNGLPNCRRN